MDQEGSELGLFQISKTKWSNLNLCNTSKAQFTNRLTKQPTQDIKDTTRYKARQGRAKLWSLGSSTWINLHESKCLNVKNGQEMTGFFPVVSMCWHTPLIHVVTLTKSLRSPSRRGGAQVTYKLLRAPTILGKLRKKHLQSPRSPRCCQSPRVTS